VPLPVVYRQAARRDVIEAARDYELERPGLAGAFIAEVERIEEFISEVPGLYQLVDGDVRRATLRRFPYGLFYLEERDRILVLACIDLRRDPQRSRGWSRTAS
jgi:plasmid stabilization system protein ParE